MQVTLRKWALDDASAVAKYANNKRIADNLRDAFPHPYALEDALAFLTGCTEADENLSVQRAVCLDGEVVGSIGVFRGGDVYRRSAEIGYWLAEPFWGRGIMPQAVRAICRQVFAQTDIVRIKAEVYAPNKASERVLEKCGFVREGVLRSSVYKNGVILDSLCYALVRERGGEESR